MGGSWQGTKSTLALLHCTGGGDACKETGPAQLVLLYPDAERCVEPSN